jgi:hypothetical protein
MAWNPYLDEWAAAHGSRVRGWICNGQLGVDASEHRALACWPDTEHNRRLIRSHLVRKYAFGVPDERALACLARYAPIVEIGAGTGYWARCLRERGVDVVAYDELGEQWQAWFRPSVLQNMEIRYGVRALVTQPDPTRSDPVRWTELLKGGPEVLVEHADRTLLLCWPDPWSGFEEAALRAHLGKYVVFVGDPGNGGEGNAGFRTLLDRAWRRIDEAQVPRWYNSLDRLLVYQRRKRHKAKIPHSAGWGVI